MMKRYDMIVVGAGPAGLSAAIEAAKKGMHVVVYDENAKPADSCSNRSTSSLALRNTRRRSVDSISAKNFWQRQRLLVLKLF